MTSLRDFFQQLQTTDIEQLRAGLIGNELPFSTPFGEQKLLYADYVASGRALQQVEQFVLSHVLPYYSNTHTQASFCGGVISNLREEARQLIAEQVNAGSDSHVIFSGSGATAGINRIVRLLNIPARLARGEKVRVLSSWYEHHSNILPWRESGAEIQLVPLTAEGELDINALQQLLENTGYDLTIGAFSAGSNVTGLLTDTDTVTRLLKRAGALAIWDYAAVAPYIQIDFGAGEYAKDALVFSPHKFPGGPGASGITVLRNSLAAIDTPTAPGGGSVSFVSPNLHCYSQKLIAREEAGTPNVVGDIRAALALLVKAAVGQDYIHQRETELRAQALQAWQNVEGLKLIGPQFADSLPIFSFQLIKPDGERLHHQLATRLLSDLFGIQARGGCACAGPYAHHLLNISEEESQTLQQALAAGDELSKPGWVRLNLSYLHSEEQLARILVAEKSTGEEGYQWKRCT